MKAESQFPPLLLGRALKLVLGRRVHFPRNQNGISVFDQEDFIVFRKVVVNPKEPQSPKAGALFKVTFRFASFSPRVNRILSLIPIPFIIAQPGFRSKTWLMGRETGMFQGRYEWETMEDARRYWDSFPMKLMKRRSIPETLTFEITQSS